MRKIFYRVPEVDKHKAYALEISRSYNLDDDLDAMDVAEMAARRYYSQQGGELSTWPLIFTFHYADDEPEIFRHLVERRDRPHFIAVNLMEEEAA